MLRPMPLNSRPQRIREEFERVGPMTARAFARHCIAVGIWDADEIAGFALKTAQQQVMSALRAPDSTGLPFAGPTTTRGDSGDADDSEIESGPNWWAQRAFWGYEDYVLNIGERVKQRDAMHFHAVDLADECRARFGRAPLILAPQRNPPSLESAAD